MTVGGEQPLAEYHHGPLMLSSKLYLIFWGSENSFPASYTTPIIQYAKDLEADGSLTTDEFSVAEQYTIEPGECTFSTELGFCAYHAQITGIGSSNDVATYSDLPYMSECDSEQAPAGVGGDKDADGTLDSEIHELVESATDPDDESGYYDKNSEEVADKCTYPTVEEQPEIYGTPLGGSLTEFTASNQLIDGHSYYTQQIWSNAPTQTPATSEPAGCVARSGPTPSFTAPTIAKTGQIVEFEAAPGSNRARTQTAPPAGNPRLRLSGHTAT